MVVQVPNENEFVLFITALPLLPYSVYLVFEGFKIMRGQQNILLLHYRLLFWLLKLIRGEKYMRMRRDKFLNSSEYTRHGWYGVYAGILMLPATILMIYDYFSKTFP